MNKRSVSLFSLWLFQQYQRDDPIGDFARDTIAAIPLAPLAAFRPKSWSSYLRKMGASAEAHEAMRAAFREYADGGVMAYFEQQRDHMLRLKGIS